MDKAPTNRQHLADELLRCRTLIGRSKPSVRVMLGRPGEASEADQGSGTLWLYELGPERSLFSVDSELLMVEFDDEKRVVSIEIVSG